MRTLTALVFTIVLFCGSVVGQVGKPTVNYNGVWWSGKSQTYREAWVSGYKSGLHQGRGKDTELTKFGTHELLDGVNKFYEDFRNRNITLHEALPYVADQLSGVPDDKLNAEILKLRKAAVADDTQ